MTDLKKILICFLISVLSLVGAELEEIDYLLNNQRIYFVLDNQGNKQFEVIDKTTNQVKILLHQYLGERRGIDVYYSDLDNSIDHYTFEFKVSHKKHFDNEINLFFCDIVNKSLLKELLKYRDKNTILKSQEEIQSSTWYNPNVKYIAIKTKQDVPYLASASEILKINPELNNVDIVNLHLLHRGEEYPFYIQSTDSKFDVSDTIFFAGKKAKGDTTLVNHYTDYEVFYLFNDSNINPSLLTLGKPVQGFQLKEYPFNKITYKDPKRYLPGQDLSNTLTVRHEGWYTMQLEMFDSPTFSIFKNYEHEFYTLFDEQNPNIKAGVYFIIYDNLHRSVFPNGAITRMVPTINNESSNYIFTGLIDSNFTYDQSKLLSGRNKFELKLNRQNVGQGENNPEISTVGIDRFEVEGNFQPVFDKNVLINIDNSSPYSSIYYSNSEEQNMLTIDNANKRIYSEKGTKFNINGSDLYRFTYESNSNGVVNLLSCPVDKIERAELFNVNESELKKHESIADMIILTHSNFYNKSVEYAQYREQSKGIKCQVIDVEDIYKEYNYGVKSIHSIKDFLKDAMSLRTYKPSYLLIIGDASYDVMKRQVFARSDDFVPAYGLPVSDSWYSHLDDSWQSSILVSRIAVATNQELENYLEKLKIYESMPRALWHKTFTFMSGGLDPNEVRYFYQNNSVFLARAIKNSILDADTAFVVQNLDSQANETKAAEIRRSINRGTMWVNYIGHASADVFDMDGWQVENLSNSGRYGIMSTLSCNTNAFAEPGLRVSRNESYLIHKENGFVMTMGNSGTGFLLPEFILLSRAYDTFIETNNRNVLAAITRGRNNLSNNNFDRNTKFQYNVLGDPLIELPIDTLPNLYINEDFVHIVSENSENQFISDKLDSVQVKFNFYNSGIINNSDFSIKLTRTYENQVDSIVIIEKLNKSRFEFISKLAVLDKPGRHNLRIQVDYNNAIIESVEFDNEITLQFEVFTGGLLPLDPLDNWNIDISKQQFRFVKPDYLMGERLDYSFTIYDQQGEVVVPQNAGSIAENLNYVDFYTSYEYIIGKKYTIEAKYFDKESGLFSNPLFVNFYPKKGDILRLVNLESNPIDSPNDYFSSHLDTDTSNGGFLVKRLPLSYKAVGIHGSDSVGRWLLLQIDRNGKEYIIDGPYQRGFNVLKFSLVDANATPVYKRFDTWANTNKGPDTLVSKELVWFLRDSVSNDEAVLLATSDNSLNGPLFVEKKYSVGYIDTLISVLKSYGAKFADSLAFRSSYSMFYTPSDISLTKDSHNLFDSSMVEGNYYIFDKVGTFFTKQFGPAKKWKNIDVDIEISSFDLAPILTIYYHNKSGVIVDSIKQSIRESQLLNISDLDANALAFISFKLEMEREQFELGPVFKKFQVNFEPMEELTVLKSGISITPNSVLRGDEVKAEYVIENLSLRTDSFFDFRLRNFGVASNFSLTQSANLQIDSRLEKDTIFFTDSYDNDMTIDIVIDQENKILELYKFNNAYGINFNIEEDNIKPNINLYADGKLVSDNMFVALTSTFTIEIEDNSATPIDYDKNIQIRLNAEFLSPTDYVLVESFERDRPLKLRIAFTSDILEFGNINANLIRIVAIDGNGNADTLRRYVNVSRNYSLETGITYPNPSVGEINFDLNYRGPESKVGVNFDIYNSIGEKIYSFDKILGISNNTVSTNVLRNASFKPTSGVYFIVITPKEAYFEPITLKFIMIE